MSTNHHILIAYFSGQGTTKAAAELLQSLTKAELVRLDGATPYSSDYKQLVSRGQRELDQQLHPELGNKIKDFQQYDTILVGYPTWWNQPPMIIYSLFDDYDFSGKTVIPFTTSATSPMSASSGVIEHLAQAAGATFKNGLKIDNNLQQVKEWLSQNDLL